MSIKGIPDKKVMKSPTEGMSPAELVDYSIQHHKANIAGPHYDLRAGKKGVGLHSFSTRKDILGLAPGAKIEVFQQPTHSYKYKDFEGTIGPGYGAGDVKLMRSGKLLITKAEPGEIHFTTADNKPENRFALIKTKDNRWLLIKGSGPKPLDLQKEHYTSVSNEQVFDFISKLSENAIAQPKIDGALSHIVLKKKPEMYSHRISSRTGLPIVHTERFFGSRPELKLPQTLSNMVLRGEMYGVKPDGKVIPPQELGGLLNSTIAKSLKDQKDRQITLKTMLFDIAKKGNKPYNAPYSEKLKLLEDIAKHLPKDKFEVAKSVTGKEQIKQLMSDILAGKHPQTTEGIIVRDGDQKPFKLKTTNEHDVVIRDIFPAAKDSKYHRVGAGGFVYSDSQRGRILGRVGSGLSDELRKQLLNDPSDYIGRTARIRALQKLPSGKYRNPSLLALHEDY